MIPAVTWTLSVPFTVVFSLVFKKLRNRWNLHKKTMKRESYDVLTGRSHMLSRFLHEWPMTTGSLPAILLFVVTWVEKMTCQAWIKSGQCHGNRNDQHFYSCFQGWYLWNFAQRVFFQCRWLRTIEARVNGHSCKNLVLGIWPIPVKTSGDFIFTDFWLDFNDFARTFETIAIQNYYFLRTREIKRELIRKRLESYHVRKNR